MADRRPKWLIWGLASSLFLAAWLLDFGLCPQAMARPDAAYNIPSQDMNAALSAFGRTSQEPILYAPQLVKGRKSHPLNGSYSSEDALKQLLKGSGLSFRRTGANVLLIVDTNLLTGSKDEQVVTTVTGESDPELTRPPELEPIIVTAEKRPVLLRDVPLSVFAATRGVMERAGVRDFDDIPKISPSLTITKTSQPANNSINIRGIGTYAYSIATEASVAVVIDDVPQAFQAASFRALVDVQQVEILRGPQNTLFGKSASAGVVNITTQPVTDHLTAYAELMLTDDHEQRFQATASGPMGSDLKFRITGNFSQYRGNINNISTRKWLNGQSDATIRGKLVWTPRDNLSITLAPYATRTMGTCCAGAEAFVSPGVTFAQANLPQSTILQGIVPSPTNQITRMDVDAKADALDYGASLRIVRTFKGMNFLSLTAFDHYSLDDLQDTDSSDFDFNTLVPTLPKRGSANGGYFKIRSFTHEFRLTSPATGRFKYVTGLFVSQTRANRYFVRGSNDLGDFNGASSLPTTNSTAYSAYLSQGVATNYALFGNATYALSSRLELLGGMRLNREDIRYRFSDIGNNITYGDPVCSRMSPTLNIETCNHDISVTGRAGLVWRWSPALMSFATYSRGYKGMAYDLTSTLTIRRPISSGPLAGIPLADAVAAKQPVSPERVNNYEWGFKGLSFDRRLDWSLTAFFEAFEGFQAQSRDPIVGQNILNSIGRVTSQGLEGEFQARLGKRLTLFGSGTYTTAIMHEFPNAICYPFQTFAEGCVGGVQDLSGKPLFNSPRLSLYLNGQYEWPLEAGRVAFLGAGLRWQSRVIYNLLQDPDSVQKSFGIVNLSGGQRMGRVKMTVFVNNLFDQPYALTRGRDVHWNISPGSPNPTNAYSWKPARDSFRYAGVRISSTY